MKTIPQIAALGVLALALGFGARDLRAQESFKVHGHWAIDVHNADGTPVSHNEFENALEEFGPFLLTRLLTRLAVTGRWQVTIFDGLCPSDSQGSTVCRLVETDALVNQQPNVFRNLTVANGPGGVEAILSGTFTAANAGHVTSVFTGFGLCGTGTPEQCTNANTGSPTGFSGRTLSTPIAVEAGQIVQVKVTFSFS